MVQQISKYRILPGKKVRARVELLVLAPPTTDIPDAQQNVASWTTQGSTSTPTRYMFTLPSAKRSYVEPSH